MSMSVTQLRKSFPTSTTPLVPAHDVIKVGMFVCPQCKQRSEDCTSIAEWWQSGVEFDICLEHVQCPVCAATLWLYSVIDR